MVKPVGFDVHELKRQECCVTKSTVQGEWESLYNCYEVSNDVWSPVFGIKWKIKEMK